MARSLRFPNHKQNSTWTIFGYDNNDPVAYPKRVMGSGRKSGMSIHLIMRKKDVNNACKESNGFRLALHTPDEFPDMSSLYYKIPFNKETMMSVQPKVMMTSDELKEYRPRKRQCYFENDKPLKFFKAYTQSNCKLECLTGESPTLYKCDL